MTPEEIKVILDKSGYLFEQKAASVIEQLGYYTTTNRAYLDPDEHKSREIDVRAYKKIFKMETPVEVVGDCYLNCECKNSATPFVFIYRQKNKSDSFIPDGIHLVHNKYESETIWTNGVGRRREKDAFHFMELDKYHYATNTEKIAVQICKIVHNNGKKEAQHSGVIESFLYPLVKSKKIWETETAGNATSYKRCSIYYNLAVVNSKLYSIDIDVEESLPVEIKYCPFIREIQTSSLKGKFLMTFVQYDYLSEFIRQQIEEFLNQIFQVYSERTELLISNKILS